MSKAKHLVSTMLLTATKYTFSSLFNTFSYNIRMVLKQKMYRNPEIQLNLQYTS